MARALVLCVFATASFAQPLTVKGPRKTQIVFPLGAASFADEVSTTRAGQRLDTTKGFPAERALGVPDKKAVTLGCGGSITLRFVDNAVVDLPGADLYVFEDGPNVEPTRLELSVDGVRWVDVGRIEGGTRELELSGKVPKTRSSTSFASPT
jgi:OOP family OmpA-OmpF porin